MEQQWRNPQPFYHHAICIVCPQYCYQVHPFPKKGVTSSIASTYSGPNRSNSSCCFYICHVVIWHSPGWRATTLSFTWKGGVIELWHDQDISIPQFCLPVSLPENEWVFLKPHCNLSVLLCVILGPTRRKLAGEPGLQRLAGNTSEILPKKRNWFIASVSPCQKLFCVSTVIFQLWQMMINNKIIFVSCRNQSGLWTNSDKTIGR